MKSYEVVFLNCGECGGEIYAHTLFRVVTDDDAVRYVCCVCAAHVYNIPKACELVALIEGR